jgi:nucleotide-binding universal stress UspA family protein
MPAIKKILFPLDFSDSCVGAGRYVEAFVGRFQAEIMLLHAVDRGEHAPAEELRPRRQRMLDSFMAEELKYFSTQRVCRLGEPAAIIAETAQTWWPDLVMMPTHGLGLYDRLVIGSVTARILGEVDCPLWTDVHSDAAPPIEKIHCRKILCALDLNSRSRRVLEWASFLASEYQAEMKVLHAVPEMVAVAAGQLSEREMAGLDFGYARNQISRLQTAVGAGGSPLVESGDPTEIVTRTAKTFGADLLVVGRHEALGLYGQLHQHLYSIVCESPCPVLTI